MMARQDADAGSRSADWRPHALRLSLFALVVLSPLPLGGMRPLPWAFNAVVAGVVLLFWIRVAVSDQRQFRDLAGLRGPAVLGVVLLAWMALQGGLISVLNGVVLPASPIWDWAAPAVGVSPHVGAATVNPDEASVSLLRFMTVVTVFFLATRVGRDREPTLWLLKGFVYAAAGYAAYGLTTHLGGFDRVLWWPRWAYQDSVTSTFVNRNHFATFAGMGVLVAVTLLHRAWRGITGGGGDRSVRERVLAWTELVEDHKLLLISLGLLAAGLGLSLSRGGMLATALGLVVLLILLRPRRATFTGVLMSIAAVLFLILMIGGNTLARVTDVAIGQEGRIEMFHTSIEGISDAPWLGHGSGSFADVIRQYRDASVPGEKQWRFLHDSYLEFAFELGVPALLLLLAIHASLVFRLVQGLGSRRARLHAALGLALMTLVGAHALVDYSVQLPGVALPFAMLLGLAFARVLPGSVSGRFG